MPTERIPPQSIDAEQSTLGSMMLESQALHAALPMLKSSDFYRHEHQEVFDALQVMALRGEPCDLLTLSEELRQRDTLTNIGGAEYLMALVDSVPTSANVVHYAKQVRRKSLLRQIIAACSEITAAAYEETDGIEDMFTTRALQLCGDMPSEGPVLVSDVIHAHVDLLQERMNRDSTRLYASGFPTLDNYFGKLGESQFIVLKGRRGKGKTHFAIHLVQQCARAGRSALLYSLEMSMHQVLDRLMGCFGNVDSRTFRCLKSETDWAAAMSAAAALSEAQVYVCDDSRSVAQMHAEAKRLQLSGVDLGLVVVDFAELITPPTGQRSEEQELKTNARLLGKVGRDLDCTVLLISQCNKEGGERGSEGIGNRADLLLHWLCDTDSRGSLHAEKNRFGPGFTIECGIDKRTSRLWELYEEDHA